MGIRQWLHGIGQNLASEVVKWLLAPVLVATMTAAWGFADGLSGPYWFVLALQAAAAVMVCIGVWTWTKRRSSNPDEKTIREWFYGRGFSLKNIPHPDAVFAFDVEDEDGITVTVVKERQEPEFLLIQSSAKWSEDRWSQLDGTTKELIIENLQLTLIQLGIGFKMEGECGLIAETRIASNDPLLEWGLLDRVMRVRQAIIMARIVFRRSMRGIFVELRPLSIRPDHGTAGPPIQ